MDKVKTVRTYSHNARQQAVSSKQASDLFDQVAACRPQTDQHKNKGDRALKEILANAEVGKGTQKEGRKRTHAKTENQQMKRTPHSQFQWQESMGSRESSPGLFKDRSETTAKKTKAKKQSKKSVKQKDNKGIAKGKTRLKITISSSLFKPKSQSSPAKENSTGDAGAMKKCSTSMNEEFPVEAVRRNAADLTTKWTLAHGIPKAERAPSLSLSTSMYDLSNSGSVSLKTSSSPVLQPWTPAGVVKRSFVKIRTPGKVLGPVMPEPLSMDLSSPADEKVLKEGKLSSGPAAGSDSYTTVYTWTSAAGTVTNTAIQTGVVENEQPQQVNAKSALSSPTLVLKSYTQEQLHSTAIYPCGEHGHLNQTPQVSPIRETPDVTKGMMPNHTPAAATVKVSPRGPRKMRSFSSVSGRRAHPKCSTMLFTSSVADAGDAPLDVSSIRAALSEALDLKERTKTEESKIVPQNVRESEWENSAKILTSTPQAHSYRKFSLNLSSVHEPDDMGREEDELHPLQQSGRDVDSQEIVADTLSDGSFHEASLQVPEKMERCRKVDEGGSNTSKNEGQESGVLVDSLLPAAKTPSNFLEEPDKGKLGQAVDECDSISPSSMLGPKRGLPLDEDRTQELPSASDGCVHHVSEDAERCVENNADIQDFHLEAGDHLSQGTSEIQSRKTSLKMKIKHCRQQRGRELNERHCGSQADEFCKVGILQADTYEPCPVSSLGTRDCSIMPKVTKQSSFRIRLPSFPADSGFLDMQDVPPDDITILSLRASKQIIRN